MSWLGFFASLEKGAWAGITWLYNNTIGGFANYIGGAVLSGAEQFAADAMGAILAVFGGVLNWIASAIGSAMWIGVEIANSLGIWGPPLAIIALAAFILALYQVTKTILRLV